MTAVDKASLFAGCSLEEADVELPGIGTIRVRTLSRMEAMRVSDTKTVEATERLMLHLGMVDPALTESEVGQWMKVAPSRMLEPVSRRIGELSGMLEDSAKAAYKSDGDRPVD